MAFFCNGIGFRVVNQTKHLNPGRVHFQSLAFAFGDNQSTFDNDGTTGGDRQYITGVVRQFAGNDGLNGVEAAAVVNRNKGNAGF